LHFQFQTCINKNGEGTQFKKVSASFIFSQTTVSKQLDMPWENPVKQKEHKNIQSSGNKIIQKEERARTETEQERGNEN
jgi:hypothetical protein